MANFSALKTAIQNAIKQNGNEDITGDVLQQILLSIVSTMGDGSINTIEQNLSQETLARQNGDSTLQSNINAEAGARQSADNTLQSHIDAEALARGNADTQLQNAINAIKADIDNGYVYAGIATPSSTPVSGKVFYIATAAGTYTNFGGQVLTQGINILRFNGSAWSNQQLIGIDDVPTAGSNSFVKSGGVQNELALGAVYDVSAKNPTAGPNNDGKWESLSALFSDANLNTLIPTAYRKGGMSIKFVHSSDNKYVQYRFMLSEFTAAQFTNTANWQGVDDVPTADSKNLVESGGVSRFKSYNFTKNDYTNSLIKEIRIEGTRDENLKYFVRTCLRISPYDNKLRFAICSFNTNTQERTVICDFTGISESGVYKQDYGNYTTSIYVTIENQNNNDGGLDAVDYAEQYEINNICWGGEDSCPLIFLSDNVDLLLSQNVVVANTDKPITQKYQLVSGYWSEDGITASPGFYCTSQLIPVQPGVKVKTIGFIKPNSVGAFAAGFLYDRNGVAVGTRLNVSNFTYFADDDSYSYTIPTTPEYSSVAYIGLDTMQNSTSGQILLFYPTKIKDFYAEQILDATTLHLNETDIAIGLTPKHVDVVMFMGQSNMAGRGITNASHPQTAPSVTKGFGYEFRPISDPTKLYPITEPFGVAENKSGGINDGSSKTGSMVSSFVNAYFETTKKVIVGVSASQGGTDSSQWLPTGILLPDAIQRLNDCCSYLTDNGYTIDHKYMVWCQGENDGANNVSAQTYKSNFRTMLDALKNEGIECCFIVRIGKYNGTVSSIDLDDIIVAQSELCQQYDDCIMASTALAAFKDMGLMKDDFHYYQDAYNYVGTYAGRNVGLYRNFGIGKPQYDIMTNSLFFTDKDY